MKKTILILDDDPLSLLRFKEMLEDSYILKYSTDQNVAFDMILQGTPDLLIVDISLVGLSGYQFAEQVRELPSCRDIPVIFCSSLTSGRIVAKAQSYNSSIFVSKSADTSSYLAALNALLNPTYTGLVQGSSEQLCFSSRVA